MAELEPTDDRADRALYGRLAADESHHEMAARFGVPCRREYTLATIPVPSQTLLLIDPTLDDGIEIQGLVECQALVQPKVWTLPDGSSLVGGVNIQVAGAKSSFLERNTIRSLGRVRIVSGMLVIVDRESWFALSAANRRELLPRVERNGFGEFTIGEHSVTTSAVVLPTGYGAGNYAVVATLRQDRIVGVDVFMLKGNVPTSSA